MNNYETIFLIKDDILEEKRKSVLKEITNFIEENGKIDEIQDIGEKFLAYTIQNQSKAYYYLIQFKMEKNTLHKLEMLYRYTEEILKFMIVKI